MDFAEMGNAEGVDVLGPESCNHVQLIDGDDDSDDGFGSFFAPVSFDAIDSLVMQYRAARMNIMKLESIVAAEDLGGVIQYFISGNCGRDEQLQRSIYVDKLFRSEGAIKALNAGYWSKLLGMTGVLEWMPQATRQKWLDQIKECDTPDFENDAVRATLEDLMLSREHHFGMMVAGIFENLSRTHVTNSPLGFQKRMILNYAISSYGYADHSTCGYISDLRKVIARFMGRDAPGWSSSNRLVEIAYRRHGKWCTIDGGALRIRVYLKGTAHLEVHPLIAYRLNQVLASVYPMAIAHEARRKPKRAAKEFALMERPLPFAVVEMLHAMERARYFEGKGYDAKRILIPNALEFKFGERDKQVQARACEVLQMLGGVELRRGNHTYWQFDYDIEPVLEDVVMSGCVPDYKSYQFYPTQPRMAEAVMALANEGATEEMTWLEPQAGIGGIADFMPKERLTCVEVSGQHCRVLEQKGFAVIQGDFLEIAPSWDKRFDRICLNPPFANGRAVAHLEAAAGLVASGGRLVAILPLSLRGKALLDPALWKMNWFGPFDNQFANTSISVAILCADRV